MDAVFPSKGVIFARCFTRHISRSLDNNQEKFYNTPIHQANKDYYAAQSEINARYYEQMKALKKTCEEELREVKALEEDVYRQAKADYELACEAIEGEFEWDVLAAELSVHAKAFHYFKNIKHDDVVMINQIINKERVVASDVKPVLERSKQENRHVFFKADKRFDKPSRGCVPLERIDEYNREGCQNMSQAW